MNLTNRDKYIYKHCKVEGFGDKYDTFHFKGMSGAVLAHCVEKGWADLEEAQNLGPCIREMLAFLKIHPSFTAHGYVVSPNRTDTRISIEGLASDNADEKSVQDFIDMFRLADEFKADTDYCYCWYD